jgi:hypothetical protein
MTGSQKCVSYPGVESPYNPVVTFGWKTEVSELACFDSDTQSYEFAIRKSGFGPRCWIVMVQGCGISSPD